MSERYSRQILLKEIGKEGQELISQKKVAILGMGALGTVSAELLTRAGVGSLLLIDRDVVEESNLQRQTLFTEKDLRKSKAITAKTKLQEINSTIKIEAEAIHLNSENIDLLNDADLILDCTDNLKTRFLLNDYCKKNKKPWVYSAAIKTSGYVMPILPEGPCLMCFLKEANLETCDTSGVLNTLTTSIASLQTTKAIKIILGKETESLLYHYDIWNEEFKKLKIRPREGCETCQGKYVYLDNSNNSNNKPIRFCSAGKYQIGGPVKDFAALIKTWRELGKVKSDGATLQFQNIMLFKDGRALIKANSEEEAQAVYSKFIGN